MARPSTTVQAISDFIAGCKADGVWSKITEAYLMAGVTFGGITVKLKGTGTLTNNNFVSGDYQATGVGAGLAGDGSTKYIDTGLLWGSVNSNSFSFSVYSTIDGVGPMITVRANSHEIYDAGSFKALRADNNYINNLSGGVGFDIVTKKTISESEGFFNGTSIGVDVPDQNDPLNSDEFTLFNRSSFWYSGALTFAHIGTGLTDTDASNLTNRVETLMDALGCGVIS